MFGLLKNGKLRLRRTTDRGDLKKLLGELCQARINRHEFQAAYDRRSLLKLVAIVESQQEELHLARAEEVQQRDQEPLQGQLLQQNLELREARQRSLTEMEEFKMLQSSTFDTIARRKLVEDQNTNLELQELQNEIKCMNDSKEFQDAESIRSGNSHVTSRPVSFALIQFLKECQAVLSHRRAAKKGRQAFGTHMVCLETFCKSRSVIISTLSSRIESMEFIDRGAASFIHSGKE